MGIRDIASTQSAVGIETERLRLEPLSLSHTEAFVDYLTRNRTHVAPWEASQPGLFYTALHQQSEIAAAQDSALRDVYVRFVAFEREGDEIVAIVNLWNIRRRVMQSALLGYSVDATREGIGYATEAAASMVRYGFDRLNLHRIEATYQPTNERSGRVLRKLGFTVEGYARDYINIDGEWRDSILVGLTNGHRKSEIP